MTALLPLGEAPAASHLAGWSRLGAAAAITAALMGSSLPSPLYTEYQRLWSMSNFGISLLFASYAMGVLVTLLLMSRYGDRVGDRRHILLAGCGLIVLGNLIMALASHPWILMPGRICSGMATGLLVGTASAALLELHPRGDARAAAVHATVAFTLGAALGPVISGLMIRLDWWPLQLSYVPVALLALLAAPLIRLTPIPVWQAAPHAPAPSRSAAMASTANRNTAVWPMLFAILVLLQSWSIGSVFMASGTRFALELAHVGGVVQAAALISVFQFLAACGQLLAGRMSQQAAIRTGVTIAMLAQGGTALAAWGHSPGGFSVGIAIAGFGYGLAFVGATALVNIHSLPHNRARMMSIFYVCGYVLGNALPALAVGALIDALDLGTAHRLFSATLVLMSLLLLMLSIRKRTRIFEQPAV